MFDFALLSLSLIALIISVLSITNNTKLELYEKREEILRFSNSLVSTLYKEEKINKEEQISVEELEKNESHYFSRFIYTYSKINGLEELEELISIDPEQGLEQGIIKQFNSLSNNLKYKSSLAKNIIKEKNISFLLEDFEKLISAIFDMKKILYISYKLIPTNPKAYEEQKEKHLEKIQNLEKELDKTIKFIKEEKIIEKAMKNYLKIFTIK